MKKILSALTLSIFLAVLVVPMVVSAVTAPTEIAGQCTLRHDLSGATWVAKGFVCPASGVCLFSSTTNTCGTCCLMDAVYTVTDWVFVFVIVVAGIMIVYGGFVLATSAGTPEKITTGRNYILYGAIGVVVALLAKAIPTLVTSILSLGV